MMTSVPAAAFLRPLTRTTKTSRHFVSSFSRVRHSKWIQCHTSRHRQLYSSLNQIQNLQHDTFVLEKIQDANLLQFLLQKYGAPGSTECNKPGNDLQPIVLSPNKNSNNNEVTGDDERSTIMTSNDNLSNLHPYLYPLAKSVSTDAYICALMNPFEAVLQWPIVEAKEKSRGYNMLSLNSQLLMRRIICQADFENNGDFEETLKVYNTAIQQQQQSKTLDKSILPFEIGSVRKLNLGLTKYLLLKVGPFVDLYQQISQQHLQKGDLQAALIAAETCTAKFNTQGLQTAACFRFYARLLLKTNRLEESRDAARTCLKLPLASIGMAEADFVETAILGQIATDSNDSTIALQQMADFYDKIQASNQEKSMEQVVHDRLSAMLDKESLGDCNWASLRQQVSDDLESIGSHSVANIIRQLSN